MDVDKFIGEFIESSKELGVDSMYNRYKDISKSIPFMMMGLDMIKDSYPELQIYEDIIHMSKFTSKWPVLSVHLTREKVDKLTKTINKFKKSRRKYLVIYLSLTFDVGGHATVLLIEKKKKILVMERYDPDYHPGSDQELIDQYMNVLSTSLGIEYIPASIACPFIGPQTAMGDSYGYCQTFVLLYIKDRLRYILSDQVKIVDATFKKLKDGKLFVIELDNIIKSVIRYIFSTYTIPDNVKADILNYNNIPYSNKISLMGYLVSLRQHHKV